MIISQLTDKVILNVILVTLITAANSIWNSTKDASPYWEKDKIYFSNESVSFSSGVNLHEAVFSVRAKNPTNVIGYKILRCREGFESQMEQIAFIPSQQLQKSSNGFSYVDTPPAFGAYAYEFIEMHGDRSEKVVARDILTFRNAPIGSLYTEATIHSNRSRTL